MQRPELSAVGVDYGEGVWKRIDKAAGDLVRFSRHVGSVHTLNEARPDDTMPTHASVITARDDGSCLSFSQSAILLGTTIIMIALSIVNFSLAIVVLCFIWPMVMVASVSRSAKSPVTRLLNTAIVVVYSPLLWRCIVPIVYGSHASAFVDSLTSHDDDNSYAGDVALAFVYIPVYLIASLDDVLRLLYNMVGIPSFHPSPVGGM